MTEPECSSPACAMHEADDVYMGYAGRAELAAALTRLSALAGPEEPWRSMLAGHLQALQGDLPGDPPGPTDAAAPDQVVRLLRALLPRVRDDRLHAELTKMLKAHEGIAG